MTQNQLRYHELQEKIRSDLENEAISKSEAKSRMIQANAAKKQVDLAQERQIVDLAMRPYETTIDAIGAVGSVLGNIGRLFGGSGLSKAGSAAQSSVNPRYVDEPIKKSQQGGLYNGKGQRIG